MVGPPPGRGTAVGLMWSKNKQGNWNGKVGPITLFIDCWHTAKGRWFISPNCPG